MAIFPFLALACRAELRLAPGGPARHGGRVLQAEGISVELVVHRAGAAVHPLDAYGIPIPVEGLAGEIRLVRAGRVRILPLAAVLDPGGPGHLAGRRPMAHFAGTGWTAEIHLQGLPEVEGGRLVLSTPVPPLPAAIEGRILPRGDPALIAPLAAYRLDRCPVSGEPLGARPIDYLWDGRLIRFCTAGCIRVFLADPGPVLARLEGRSPLPSPGPTCHSPGGAP